jgi:hypothetical protein
VQCQIQGDAVRITGAKRDDLQAAMALLRKALAELPLGFNNFRTDDLHAGPCFARRTLLRRAACCWLAATLAHAQGMVLAGRDGGPGAAGHRRQAAHAGRGCHVRRALLRWNGDEAELVPPRQ